MTNHFDYVRAAVYTAAEKLGAGQQLQVAIWRDDNVTPYPQKGFVNKGELETLREEFDAIGSRGSSEIVECMKASLTLGGGADQVIFITAKPSLDVSIAEDVLTAKTASVRIDGIKIDAEDSTSPLEELAKKTGGTYLYMSGATLQNMIQ